MKWRYINVSKASTSIVNGQTYTLTYNSNTGKYETTVTAPSRSSYSQSGHYYGITIKATDDAGNVTTKMRQIPQSVVR